jgi:putative hydrolase of the HAD superfamily
MTVRVTAVAFDYGGVLSLPLDPESVRTLADWCGLPTERFAAEHRRERLSYDRGDFDLHGYWSRILAVGGAAADDGLLGRLNREDLRGWGRVNERMLAWSRELRAAGIRTAILSNMPQPLLRLMRADAGFGWMREFDVQLFSCDVHMVKPEAGIYRRLLELLAVEAARCAFFDDVAENADGARAVGIQGFHHRSVEETAGIARSLGLPVEALRTR